MTLTFVDTNGNENSIGSSLSIQNMLTLRQTEKMSWFNSKKPETTIAGRAGLNYVQMESLRRSLTWHEEATAFIDATAGLEYSDETLKFLGCMSAERKSQPQKGNRNGGGNGSAGMSKTKYQELGEHLVAKLTNNGDSVPDDCIVTLDWAKESATMVVTEFQERESVLPAFPKKSKKLTDAEKNVALEAQVEALNAQIAELMKAQGNKPDAK